MKWCGSVSKHRFFIGLKLGYKTVLENLYIGISRVDWKVSILTYRFSRNFFIAEIASDYGLVRIDFKTTTEWFLGGRPKIKPKV